MDEAERSRIGRAIHWIGWWKPIIVVMFGVLATAFGFGAKSTAIAKKSDIAMVNMRIDATNGRITSVESRQALQQQDRVRDHEDLIEMRRSIERIDGRQERMMELVTGIGRAVGSETGTRRGR